MPDRVALHVYVKNLKKRVDAFEAMWRAHNAKPDERKDWPLTADSVDDWDEQFRAWMDDPND